MCLEKAIFLEIDVGVIVVPFNVIELGVKNEWFKLFAVQ